MLQVQTKQGYKNNVNNNKTQYHCLSEKEKTLVQTIAVTLLLNLAFKASSFVECDPCVDDEPDCLISIVSLRNDTFLCLAVV